MFSNSDFLFSYMKDLQHNYVHVKTAVVCFPSEFCDGVVSDHFASVAERPDFMPLFHIVITKIM